MDTDDPTKKFASGLPFEEQLPRQSVSDAIERLAAARDRRARRGKRFPPALRAADRLASKVSTSRSVPPKKMVLDPIPPEFVTLRDRITGESE